MKSFPGARGSVPRLLWIPALALALGACGDDEPEGNGTGPPPNEPPSVQITSPPDDSRFDEGTEITFEGSAMDPEDGALTGTSLRWSSSLDGVFQTGTTARTRVLSVGQHTITLTAVDSEDASASASIGVRIDPPPPQPPTAQILSPADGALFAQGADVDFLGAGDDPDGADLPESAFAWSSDVDGAIGTGRSFTRNDLSAGPHTITLTVTDAQNLIGTASVSITITVAP